MNKKQKKKLALFAIILAVVIVVILLVTLIANCTGCVGNTAETASNSAQQRSSVIISEVLASNKQAVRDPMGTYSDYIELYNAGTEAANISGYGLSDSETDVWAIPDGTILQPGEYLVIWCTRDATGLSNFTDFALSKTDVLRFIDGGGGLITTVSLADTYSGLS